MSCAIAVVRALRAVHTGVDPDYEKVLTEAYKRFLSQIPDPIIVDVGAYIGVHLAQFVNFGRTIAFEPVPAAADALAQRFPQADVREMALGREPSTATFYYLPEAAGMSGLQMRDTHGRTSVVQPINVRIETLDRQLADLPYLTSSKWISRAARSIALPAGVTQSGACARSSALNMAGRAMRHTVRPR